MSTEKYLSAGQRWGRWHWMRVAWLRGISFPFWHTVNAVRRMRMALRYDINLVTNEELWELTTPLDEHPDGWDHACMCAECRSCG